jgi:hypothetical protein
MSKLNALKSAIYQMGLRFNQQPTPERIEAYAKDLAQFTPDQVTYAFREVIRSGSAYFPSLAEILKHLQPQEVSSDDIANMVVNEIVGKCIDHGQYRIAKIQAELSEIARAVVQLSPSILMNICTSMEDQLPTIKAQLRGFVRAVVENKRAAIKNEKLTELGIDTSKAISIEDRRGTLRAIDFSGFTAEAK